MLKLFKVFLVVITPWALLTSHASVRTPAESAESTSRISFLISTHGDEQNAAQPASQKNLDPAAWGSNHVGKAVPEFVSGNECLFCHRNDIGPTWQSNAHGATVRVREDAPKFQEILKSQPSLATTAAQVEYFM